MKYSTYPHTHFPFFPFSGDKKKINLHSLTCKSLLLGISDTENTVVKQVHYEEPALPCICCKTTWFWHLHCLQCSNNQVIFPLHIAVSYKFTT